MPDRPAGTVTFLFTDIEGSTKLWEKHPDAMQAALARHDAILRGAIEKNRGCVFKTVGDAFCAAFPTALDGLNAALAAQRALNLESWGETRVKARMGLHTGSVEERDGDYFGRPLNRVARLFSTGHGGQTLLSLATAELLRDNLPKDVTLRDLGEARLKDLERPEHIFQVIVPDLPADFPPLKTLDTLPNNLPIQLTSFVGREKEIEKIKRLLSHARLLTLTGAGGSGKTRLALQVAADMLEEFTNGVWFVELASLADAALIAQSVATNLRLQEQQGTSLEEVLKAYLRAKSLLLILDNCEHLIEACAKFADMLLHSSPNLKILATSREALRADGETTYRVPSLAMPDPKQLPSLESLFQFDAVRLFIDRAVMAQASFAVTNQNAPAVVQICHRLDGIPLAIELAASRVRVFSAEEISARLDDRFRLLTGGSRTALPRQQSLHALIDWSYNLMSESERILFRRLSIFAGGWTFDAMQAICASNEIAAIDLVELLSHLIDKSVVIAEEHDGETRYRFLETIRQYAGEKLAESHEEPLLHQRHLEFYLKLVRQAAPKFHTADELLWLNRLELEHDNLRAALGWSMSSGDSEIGLMMAESLHWFWRGRNATEGREWLERLLALPRSGEYRRARANALCAAGGLCYNQGDLIRARIHLDEGLASLRELDDREGIVEALLDLGKVTFFQKDHIAAKSFLDEALSISRALGYKWAIAESLHMLGHAIAGLGDDGQAHLLYEESVAKFREIGAKLILTYPLTDLGREAHGKGDFAKARSIFEENVMILREFGNTQGIAINHMEIGFVDLAVGDHAKARSQLDKSLTLLRELGDKKFTAECLEGLAGVNCLQGQTTRAARLVGAAEALRELSGMPVPPYRRADYERILTTVRAQSDEATFAKAWSEGRAMTMEQAIEYALEENYIKLSYGHSLR